MRNRHTWEFAHYYCGRLLRMIGWILFIVSIVVTVFAIGKNLDIIDAFGEILYGTQVIFVIICIFLTEQALKQTFDENGIRRK